MSEIYHVALIGIGHRGYKTHFLSLHTSESEAIVAVCDANRKTLDQFSAKYPDIPAYESIEDLLAHHKPDFALVCLPHTVYGSCIDALSVAGVPVLKEKPAADNLQEFDALTRLPIPIGVMFQKRFEPRYHQLKSLLPFLGRIVSFRAVLARNIENLASSWRASGVGVAEDLGVHMIDMITWLFGKPSALNALKIDGVRQFQKYSGDDIADISFKWNDRHLIGNVHLSRVAHADSEVITITGTTGTAILNDRKVSLIDSSGTQIVSVEDTSSKQMVVRRMVREFGDSLHDSKSKYQSSLESHRSTVQVFEAAKLSFQSEKGEYIPIRPNSGEDCPWPVITPEIETALIDQAHSSLSIYNRSNVYETFEDKWCKLHRLKHALVCSSGTVAILHMFEALNLQPGDEILCPVYTFFATATPMLQYGAVPVFCDSLEDGNIDPEEILKRSTKKTRAVIVTHMWGLPCRMTEIIRNAKSVGIKTLEDCSHAHTAIVEGNMVGTQSDMAAWSLQAKKNVTGGQAGVFATNNTDYYAHAITHGHFNKRAKQEVPEDHPLRKFWLTGLGLNLRAHPLAIAMANVQLSNHQVTQDWREHWARRIHHHLKTISFLRMPEVANADTDRHAWYAFVMQFDESRAPPGLTREKFVSLLTDRGLSEVDVPRSTGLLHDLPLFTETAEAFPRFGNPGPWKAPQRKEEFPKALAFYNGAIKLPMWYDAHDGPMVDKYITGFLDVAHEQLNPSSPIVKVMDHQLPSPVKKRDSVTSGTLLNEFSKLTVTNAVANRTVKGVERGTGTNDQVLDGSNTIRRFIKGKTSKEVLNGVPNGADTNSIGVNGNNGNNSNGIATNGVH
ncbi:PLP-dependent transferase [Myriangium duriaei CBS 260.36]|uniref:PLP-dependent transferase n=1 Tax=Myriangium duriaei CBS 260.36 TaxID=1168546 RepID=A0A9P4IUD1_9PEZI|nr:PLP-dependent transferase [Myriangium duriaei CBS 260.36]